MGQVIGPLFDRAPMDTVPFRDDRATRGPSNANEGTGTVQMSWDGIEPDQVREWYENENPYRNLAGNPAIASRARAYVLEHVRQYDQKTLRLQRKWQALNYLLQGNSLVSWEDPDGVHSPQLFQMVENLEARITDAVLATSSGVDKWFAVKGRDEMDRRQEQVIAAFLDYQLDKNRFKSKVPELVRTMLVHSFCVLKTRWETEIDYFVEKTRTKEVTRLGPRWKTKRKEVEKVQYQGNRFDSVDPFWFMCDTTQTDVRDMLWIGDRSKITYEECLEKERIGEFMNCRELEGQEPRAWGETFADWTRWTRSQTYPYEQLHAFQRPEGAPKEFYKVEIWGKFDLYGTGLARECVITVINNETVVQVRENPLDDKHRPYAIARACKYPFDFHSVGPLDHCIQLQIEIDTHRSLAVEGSRLAVNPMIFIDQAGDLGDSEYTVYPGKVWEVNANSVKFSQIKSPVPEMVQMEGVLRTDMEETAGSPRGYMGGDGGGGMSATEYQGRIKEANKRVRSYIRSFTDMCEQLLRNMHSLCAQYMTSSQKFRVLGKKGKGLRAYEYADPEMFDNDVDFEFVAISNLQIAGMEATNLQLYLNTMAPFMQTEKDLIKLPPLAQRFAQLLLGTSAADVVEIPDDPMDLMSQDEENVILLSGDYVPISKQDDDEEHMETMELFMSSEQFMGSEEGVKSATMQHYWAHQRQAKAKVQAERVRQEKMKQQAGMEQQGYAGQGSTPGSMNNMQMAMSAGPSQTNGPVNGDQVASPGRMNGFFQEQNQGAA